MGKVDQLLETNLRIRTGMNTLSVLQAARRAGDGLLYKGWKLEAWRHEPDAESVITVFYIVTASLKEAGALRWRAGWKHGQFSVSKEDDPLDAQGRSLFLVLLDGEETKIVQEQIGGFIPAGPKRVVGFEAFRNYLDVLSVEMMSIDPGASCEVAIG